MGDNVFVAQYSESGTIVAGRKANLTKTIEHYVDHHRIDTCGHGHHCHHGNQSYRTSYHEQTHLEGWNHLLPGGIASCLSPALPLRRHGRGTRGGVLTLTSNR